MVYKHSAPPELGGFLLRPRPSCSYSAANNLCGGFKLEVQRIKMQFVAWSAKGAECESQGQALSLAKRVAPGIRIDIAQALKERHNLILMETISHFQCSSSLGILPGRRASPGLSTCPWPSHFAPLALGVCARALHFQLESTCDKRGISIVKCSFRFT
jgi:hypothetical protein